MSRACTGMKCGTGQAPVLPGPMEESRKQQQRVLDFPRHLCTGTYCWCKGRESEFTVVLLCKVPASPWQLWPSNPFKSRRGDRGDTGVGVVSLGRMAVDKGSPEAGLPGLARKLACC